MTQRRTTPLGEHDYRPDESGLYCTTCSLPLINQAHTSISRLDHQINQAEIYVGKLTNDLLSMRKQRIRAGVERLVPKAAFVMAEPYYEEYNCWVTITGIFDANGTALYAQDIGDYPTLLTDRTVALRQVTLDHLTDDLGAHFAAHFEHYSASGVHLFHLESWANAQVKLLPDDASHDRQREELRALCKDLAKKPK